MNKSKNFFTNPKQGLPLLFLIGFIVGIILSYFTWITPVQKKMDAQKQVYITNKNKYESLKTEINSDAKKTKEKLEKADKYYRKINGLKNEAGSPKETGIVGDAIVGKDIAPGKYQLYSKTDDVVGVTIYDIDGKKIYEEELVFGFDHYDSKYNSPLIFKLKVGQKIVAEASEVAIVKPVK